MGDEVRANEDHRPVAAVFAAMLTVIHGDDQGARVHVDTVPEAELRRCLTALVLATGQMLRNAAGSDVGAAEVAEWGRAHAVWLLSRPDLDEYQPAASSEVAEGVEADG